MLHPILMKHKDVDPVLCGVLWGRSRAHPGQWQTQHICRVIPASMCERRLHDRNCEAAQEHKIKKEMMFVQCSVGCFGVEAGRILRSGTREHGGIYTVMLNQLQCLQQNYKAN